MASTEDTRIHPDTWQQWIELLDEATHVVHQLWRDLVHNRPEHQKTIARLAKSHSHLATVRTYLLGQRAGALGHEEAMRERAEEEAAREQHEEKLKELGEAPEAEIPF